eukprot:gene11512-24075_t
MECLLTGPLVAMLGRACITRNQSNPDLGNLEPTKLSEQYYVDPVIPVYRAKAGAVKVPLRSKLQTPTDSDSSSLSSSSGNRKKSNWSIKCGYASSLKDVDILKTIGNGRFGAVRIVFCRTSQKLVYLNGYQKMILSDTCQQHIPPREKDILKSLTHPFIAQIAGTFQDKTSLYMMIDLPGGGDLSRLLIASFSSGSTTTTSTSIPRNNITPLIKPLTEKQKMFYVACVLSAFKYIHSKNILYRGLHPDTLFIDEEGYIKLVDWGFAKVVDDYTFTFCGHVEYLCPEAIVYDTGYGKGVDYWALGVLIFEMLAGRSAFITTSQHGSLYTDVDDTNTVENIITADIEYPAYFSSEACSIISGLCQKNPLLRLGCAKNGRGVLDIMNHPWFGSVDWDKLERRDVAAPWIPSAEGVKSLMYFTDDVVSDEQHVQHFD